MKRGLLGSAVVSFVLAMALASCGASGVKEEETKGTTAVTEAVQEVKKEKEEVKEETGSSEKEEAFQEDAAKRRGEAEFKDSAEKTASYLNHYFKIDLKAETDAKAFSEALKAITEKDIAVEGELDRSTAVSAAIKAAGYEELALTYTTEKAKERLKQYGLEGEGDHLSFIACALDVDLISPKEAMLLLKNEKPDKASLDTLLMKVADAVGKGRNYLGLASDPDIFGKLEKEWNSFQLFDDETLSEVGRQAVEQKITTGYGLKSAAYDARFLPELTLQYGHSDILHAQQLIGLLDSENINARIQLEPKISIYQYLLDWGPVPDPTPTYEVKKFSDDLYLVYAVEYDLKLEFADTEDLMAFDKLIKTFAKKNSENADLKGLIYGSWWQPLYSTVREDMPKEDYHKIYDCVVTNGNYSIHPFTTEEKKDEVLKRLSALSEGLSVEPEKRYVNTAFYNYLTGEDYQ
ncbi:MAG: hypothetical protein HXM92_01580 [Oribacterium parvum]|uniref:hypothetical protein n=1 Tax=Oribacterium parvum TaxID=1501329 RepID=UPI001CADDCEB|nr:hypothetical protein [Oribacterium parvum]MBF1268190.1 hypothetical protein [Oribacterium parvum]